MSKYFKISIALLLTLSLVFAFFQRSALANFVQNAWQGYKLTEGLVGYWSFDGKDIDLSQVTAEVRDRSGQTGHDGDWRSHATTTTIGKIGQGINFDGVNDYIEVSGGAGYPTLDTAYTVSAWVKSNTISGNLVFASYRSTLSVNPIIFQLEQNNADVRFVVRDDATNVATATYTSGLTVGGWYHIVGVRNGNNLSVYVNSVAGSGALGDFGVASANNIDIGAFVAGSSVRSGFANGAIDEVRIYNRAISVDEIKRLYLMGASLKTNVTHRDELTEGLVGNWTFDGRDMVRNVADVSGQGNNGMLVGQTSTTTTIGKIGQAINFDGVDDMIAITSDPSVSANGSFTYSLWIMLRSYTNGLASDGAGTYFLDRSIASNPLVSLKAVSDKYCFQKRYDDASGLGCVSTTDNITLNEWTNIVLVRDYNNNFYIYRNGVQSGSAVDSGSKALTPKAPRIGRHQTGGGATNGSFDETRIYNRALSADEIKRLYLMGASLKTNVTHRDELTEGLLGNWTFDGKDIDLSQVAAEVRDRSGQGNNGDWRNHATTTSIGKIGQAINFDGTDDLISMGTVLNIIEPLTISAWIYPTSYGGGSRGRIVDKDGNVAAGYWFSVDNSNVTSGLGFGINAGGLGTEFLGVANVTTLNKWQYVTATLDANKLATIYVDGVGVGSGTLNAFPATNVNNFVIGGRTTDNTRNFSGNLDDVRIYNRAISANEVKRLYLMGK